MLSIGCRVENKFAGYGSNKWHGVVEDGPDDKGKWAVRWAEDAAVMVEYTEKLLLKWLVAGSAPPPAAELAPFADEEPEPFADEEPEPFADEEPEPFAGEEPEPFAGEEPELAPEPRDVLVDLSNSETAAAEPLPGADAPLSFGGPAPAARPQSLTLKIDEIDGIKGRAGRKRLRWWCTTAIPRECSQGAGDPERRDKLKRKLEAMSGTFTVSDAAKLDKYPWPS